ARRKSNGVVNSGLWLRLEPRLPAGEQRQCRIAIVKERDVYRPNDQTLERYAVTVDFGIRAKIGNDEQFHDSLSPHQVSDLVVRSSGLAILTVFGPSRTP